MIENKEDLQMQINSLKLEIERINNVMNVDHVKLNQLTQKFNAHRDKKNLHLEEGDNDLK